MLSRCNLVSAINHCRANRYLLETSRLRAAMRQVATTALLSRLGVESRLRISRLILTAGTGTATEGGPVRHGSGGTSRAWESEPGIKRTLWTACSPDAYCDSRLIIFHGVRGTVPTQELQVFIIERIRGAEKLLQASRARPGKCRMSFRSVSSGERSGTANMRSLRSSFPFSPVRLQGYRLARIEEQRRDMSVRRV
jgi:hypothetical protein